MRMRARDSFFASETGQIPAGREFDIESEGRGQEFIERGLAERVDEAPVKGLDQNAIKKAPPPSNKAEPRPDNKAEPRPDNKVAPTMTAASKTTASDQN